MSRCMNGPMGCDYPRCGCNSGREQFEAWASNYPMRPAGWTEACWNAWQAGRASAVPQWKPIETAPKDGSMFLCWVSAVRYGETDEGQQYQQDASQPDFCWWREGLDGNGYFDPACGQVGDLQTVTHWMPLPAAPSKEGQ